MFKFTPYLKIAATLCASTTALSANAALFNWADWQSGTATQIQGVITTPSTSINVTYTNNNSYHFLQTGTGIDYFENSNGAAISPYTSSTVDNIPTASEMIALENAGAQSLVFSETVANPVFAFVSLNDNGYSFDQDFDILSYGDPTDGNDCGYWGCGTSSKQIVTVGGITSYRLVGTGEPHGTIQFKGAFDTLTWNSLTDETWNGFTVGIEGTADDIFDVPEPYAFAALVFSFALLNIRKAHK